MDCDRIQQYYTDLFEGALNPSLRERVSRHMSVCTSCREDYERFTEAMSLLDGSVEEVEPPSGFRAAVLARVAAEAGRAPDRVGIFEWLVLRSAALKLAGALALAAGLVVVAFKDAPLSRNALQGDMISNLRSKSAPIASVGVFRKIGTLVGTGRTTYHDFTIQLPSGTMPSNVAAYVLQDGRAMSADSALDDPSSAIFAWKASQPIAGDVQVSIPIGVDATLPPGSTLALLVRSVPVDSSGEGRRDLAFVPLDTAARPTVAIASGADLFTTVRAASASQGVTIVIDDSAIEAASRNGFTAPSGLDGSVPLAALLADQQRLQPVPLAGGGYAIVAR